RALRRAVTARGVFQPVTVVSTSPSRRRTLSCCDVAVSIWTFTGAPPLSPARTGSEGRLDGRAVRHDAVLRNDHDSIPNVIHRMVDVLGFAGGRDDHVAAD